VYGVRPVEPARACPAQTTRQHRMGQGVGSPLFPLGAPAGWGPVLDPPARLGYRSAPQIGWRTSFVRTFQTIISSRENRLPHSWHEPNCARSTRQSFGLEHSNGARGTRRGRALSCRSYSSRSSSVKSASVLVFGFCCSRGSAGSPATLVTVSMWICFVVGDEAKRRRTSFGSR